MTIMGRRIASSTVAVPAPEHSATRRGFQDDESKVRTYLRLLVEAPVRVSDRVEPAEVAFVEVGADWAARSGVDRSTLAKLGVPRRVLDAAGISPTPIGELVQRQYGTTPFTGADLMRKSGVSMASVRNVLAEDERAGRIRRVASKGRAIRYELA